MNQDFAQLILKNYHPTFEEVYHHFNNFRIIFSNSKLFDMQNAPCDFNNK